MVRLNVEIVCDRNPDTKWLPYHEAPMMSIFPECYENDGVGLVVGSNERQ